MKKIKYAKINVYCDMDGVIADFNNEPNALQRFDNEKGFFKNLKPMNEWGFNQLLNNKNIRLFILSAIKLHKSSYEISLIVFCLFFYFII